MAKIIQLTETEFITLRKEFEQALKLIKVSDGKVNFTKQFGSFDRKATLYFTSEAHEKMQALVREFDKEVAWHGVAERCDNEKEDGYLVSDILVYPQTVTGASVDMDVNEYDKWIRDNADDERMYRLRMQGHSHVNMGVTASSVDLKHQSDILRMIPKTGFYIFIIINKKNEWNVKIYDLKKNVLFEEKDVKVSVLPPDGDIPEPVFTGVSEDEEKALRSLLEKIRSGKRTKDFVAEAKKMVRDRTYTAKTYDYSGYYGSSYAGGNTSAYNGSAAASNLPAKTEQPPAKQASAPAKSEKKSEPVKAAKKKGHRKARKPETARRILDWDDDDDDFGDYFDYFRNRKK